MKSGSTYAAVDLGAESGRVVLGRLGDGAVSLEEVSRFPNHPVELADGLHWDVHGLFRGALDGVALAARDGEVSSVAVDSWGVDYGLLDENGDLLGLPYHYRDHRTDGVLDRVATDMAKGHAYETTGIRQMPINTVYQLLSEERAEVLEGAHRIALIPDLLAYWLCGVVANERTDASTTGLLDATTGEWALELIRTVGLPEALFGELVEPGTVLGALSTGHVDALGLQSDVQVVATAGHDTAAAFAGTPIQDGNSAVLSSGTWSLLGLELDSPRLTPDAQAADLSNERGVFGTVRLLRNVMGLWLLQQCRERWSDGNRPPEYSELAALAAASPEAPALFDPDHPSLMYPGDMLGRIEALMGEGGQAMPKERGGMVKSIFVSLACKYRLVVELLEQVTSKSIDLIHVVGGGSQNELLCQMTADLTGREVLAGPSEASALGNILMQACALDDLSGLDEMRDVARASFPPVSYRPAAERQAEEETYRRFLSVTGLDSRAVSGSREQGREK